MSKNFDETVCLQSEIRRQWIREVRGERLQGIVEGASSAPCLASSSAKSFLGQMRVLGTTWLMSPYRTGERRQFLPEHRSSPRQNEKEQSHLSKVPDYGWGGKRVKMGKSHTLARESGIRARAWSEKGGLHGEPKQIPRRKGRAQKMSLPRRSKRKHEQVNGRRSSPGRSAESWFHSKSGQT